MMFVSKTDKGRPAPGVLAVAFYWKSKWKVNIFHRHTKHTKLCSDCAFNVRFHHLFVVTRVFCLFCSAFFLFLYSPKMNKYYVKWTRWLAAVNMFANKYSGTRPISIRRWVLDIRFLGNNQLHAIVAGYSIQRLFNCLIWLLFPPNSTYQLFSMRKFQLPKGTDNRVFTVAMRWWCDGVYISFCFCSVFVVHRFGDCEKISPSVLSCVYFYFIFFFIQNWLVALEWVRICRMNSDSSQQLCPVCSVWCGACTIEIKKQWKL